MDEYSGEVFIFYFVDAKNKISRLWHFASFAFASFTALLRLRPLRHQNAFASDAQRRKNAKTFASAQLCQFFLLFVILLLYYKTASYEWQGFKKSLFFKQKSLVEGGAITTPACIAACMWGPCAGVSICKHILIWYYMWEQSWAFAPISCISQPCHWCMAKKECVAHWCRIKKKMAQNCAP